MSEGPLRVLFTGCPAYGHLLPMLPLMRAATRAGHDVRVATGRDMVDAMRRRGLSAYSAGPTLTEMFETRAAMPSLEGSSAEELILASARGLFGVPARRRVADLAELATEWRPDLVVHDPLELAGPILARRFGVPSVTHGYGPMFLEYRAFAPAAAEAAGDPEAWEHMRSQTALDICPPSLRPPGDAIWPDAISLRPSAGEPTHHELPDLSRLTRPQLAYLTLGTVSNTAPGQLARAVEAVRDLPLDLIVTTGPGLDPGTLGPQPSNVVVAEFIPQTQVLERASLLVSQCGAGTMLGALCHGLPQVCLPLGADQPWNAAAIERAGAAVVVPAEELSRESIRSAVDKILADPSYAEAAQRIQAEILAMPSADEVLPRVLEATAEMATTW